MQEFATSQRQFIEAERAVYDPQCAVDWVSRLKGVTCDEGNTRTGVLDCNETCDVFYGELQDGAACEHNRDDPDCGRGLVCRDGDCRYYCPDEDEPAVVVRSTHSSVELLLTCCSLGDNTSSREKYAR